MKPIKKINKIKENLKPIHLNELVDYLKSLDLYDTFVSELNKIPVFMFDNAVYTMKADDKNNYYLQVRKLNKNKPYAQYLTVDDSKKVNPVTIYNRNCNYKGYDSDSIIDVLVEALLNTIDLRIADKPVNPAFFELSFKGLNQLNLLEVSPTKNGFTVDLPQLNQSFYFESFVDDVNQDFDYASILAWHYRITGNIPDSIAMDSVIAYFAKEMIMVKNEFLPALQETFEFIADSCKDDNDFMNHLRQSFDDYLADEKNPVFYKMSPQIMRGNKLNYDNWVEYDSNRVSPYAIYHKLTNSYELFDIYNDAKADDFTDLQNLQKLFTKYKERINPSYLAINEPVSRLDDF